MKAASVHCFTHHSVRDHVFGVGRCSPLRRSASRRCFSAIFRRRPILSSWVIIMMAGTGCSRFDGNSSRPLMTTSRCGAPTHQRSAANPNASRHELPCFANGRRKISKPLEGHGAHLMRVFHHRPDEVTKGARGLGHRLLSMHAHPR